MKQLLFVTAQPDVSYFHWQCEVYGNNFVSKGISPGNIHMIFATQNDNTPPSDGAKRLADFGYNVHFYSDNRDKKHYIPSIKPYLIHKWLIDNPKFGELFFLHDADIIFRELPDYSKFIDDDICYLADTKGYIAYSYIIDCCRRYESAHPESRTNQLLEEMVDIVGLDLDCVASNQDNSGGGQYIIKDTNPNDWLKIYQDSIGLYDQMHDYQRRFPISPGEIQFWTAEMWSVLWNLWCFGKETKIIPELDFSWGTDTIEVYNKKPILHMAGVTENLRQSKFYKGDYISTNPLQVLKDNPTFFDYIDQTNATIKYIEAMKLALQKSNS